MLLNLYLHTLVESDEASGDFLLVGYMLNITEHTDDCHYWSNCLSCFFCDLLELGLHILLLVDMLLELKSLQPCYFSSLNLIQVDLNCECKEVLDTHKDFLLKGLCQISCSQN